MELKVCFLGAVRRKTFICCRNVRISASSAARDRNRSATIQTMSLTRSLIRQQHRPILDQLLVRLSLRQGHPCTPLAACRHCRKPHARKGFDRRNVRYLRPACFRVRTYDSDTNFSLVHSSTSPFCKSDRHETLDPSTAFVRRRILLTSVYGKIESEDAFVVG
jgi:hypothetical protein